MNKERLLKVIQDMQEVVSNLDECKAVLHNIGDDKTSIFIGFGLKQIFVDYFITVENLTSMILKELKKFKIGIDMKTALDILNSSGVIENEMFEFLNEARLLRNRISHRYKEPSTEELLSFIDANMTKFSGVVDVAKKYL